MAELHVVIGPVGAGKTTFARKLREEHGAVFLSLDEWMQVLFSADKRPEEGRIAWYIERTERCLRMIRQVMLQTLRAGTNVVLEPGLIQKAQRQSFYNWVDEQALDHQIYLIEADREVRRQRVIKRNEERGETFSGVVPPEFFELSSDLWEPPDELEQSERPFRFKKT